METTTPAIFVRGGTSKGLIFHARDLPPRREEWAPIFLSAMGSPDPYRRQLNGMGGGLSSLSKVCVISPSDRPNIDVEYTFAQVQIASAMVNYEGNCGNMSSAIGPLAVDEGVVPPPRDGDAGVRMLNLNTGKVVVAHFEVSGGKSVVDPSAEMEGVAGPSTRVELEFLDPGGAATGRLLPTGSAKDVLRLEDGSLVEASLVDAANPCVFVSAREVGCSGGESPAELEARPDVLRLLQQIREAASIAMGISDSLEIAKANPTTPFIAIVSGPAAFRALDGRDYSATDISLSVRFLSNGQPHRAVPVTGALCTVAAAHIPGTVVAESASDGEPVRHASREIRIGHPSGCTELSAVTEESGDVVNIVSTTLVRTTRRLFDGSVHHTVTEANLQRGLHVERRLSAAQRAGNLIFIHGSMATGSSFRALQERFPDWNTVSYDRRGYGRSLDRSAPTPALSVQLHDLETMLAGSNNVLVGHSLGADLALIVASRNPASVAAVVCYEAPLSWLPTWPRAPLPKRLEDPSDVSWHAEAFMRRALGDDGWLRIDGRQRESILSWAPAWASELIELSDGGWPFDPSSVKVPVLLLGGSESESRHQQSGETWKRELPNTASAVIHGAGHSLRNDFANDIVESIRVFLENQGVDPATT